MAMDPSQAFRTLGLEWGQCTENDVKKAFQKLALANHPDKHPGATGHKAQERMQAINAARDLIIGEDLCARQPPATQRSQTRNPQTERSYGEWPRHGEWSAPESPRSREPHSQRAYDGWHDSGNTYGKQERTRRPRTDRSHTRRDYAEQDYAERQHSQSHRPEPTYSDWRDDYQPQTDYPYSRTSDSGSTPSRAHRRPERPTHTESLCTARTITDTTYDKRTRLFTERVTSIKTYFDRIHIGDTYTDIETDIETSYYETLFA